MFGECEGMQGLLLWGAGEGVGGLSRNQPAEVAQ